MIPPKLLSMRPYQNVPMVRPGEKTDRFIQIEPEGHYHHILDIKSRTMVGCFYPWRDNQWLDPVSLPMYSMPSFSDQRYMFSALPWHAEKQCDRFNAYHRFWPEFYEDRAFALHVGVAGTRRVRNRKPYLVYLSVVQEPCDRCPFPHPHYVTVSIEDKSRTVYSRSFQCAERRQGFDHYREVLESIDLYVMEDLL